MTLRLIFCPILAIIFAQTSAFPSRMDTSVTDFNDGLADYEGGEGNAMETRLENPSPNNCSQNIVTNDGLSPPEIIPNCNSPKDVDSTKGDLAYSGVHFVVCGIVLVFFVVLFSMIFTQFCMVSCSKTNCGEQRNKIPLKKKTNNFKNFPSSNFDSDGNNESCSAMFLVPTRRQPPKISPPSKMGDAFAPRVNQKTKFAEHETNPRGPQQSLFTVIHVKDPSVSFILPPDTTSTRA